MLENFKNLTQEEFESCNFGKENLLAEFQSFSNGIARDVCFFEIENATDDFTVYVSQKANFYDEEIENVYYALDDEETVKFFASYLEKEYFNSEITDKGMKYHIDFENTVDDKAEIICDENKVNVMLYLNDAQYEAIANRTDCMKDAGVSYKEFLNDDNSTMNVYVDFHLDGKIQMELCSDSDTYGWKTYNVPLNDIEKQALKEDANRACLLQTGMTLGETVRNIVAENDAKHPSVKDGFPKCVDYDR